MQGIELAESIANRTYCRAVAAGGWLVDGGFWNPVRLDYLEAQAV